VSEIGEPRIMCGPTPENYGPGTKNFESLVKSIATSATRVGAAANYGYFFWRQKPESTVRAQEKLEQAHRLLVGAHALLAELAAIRASERS
jgi:hypothetical protein